MTDSKSRNAYSLAFMSLYDIVTSMDKVPLKLKSVTLDFEKKISLVLKAYLTLLLYLVFIILSKPCGDGFKIRDYQLKYTLNLPKHLSKR